MIANGNSHGESQPSHGRDFRTAGRPVSSILSDISSGCLRIFDIGRGTSGYDASAHLRPNNVDDNGVTYTDLIAHRRHMRWGEAVECTSPKDLGAGNPFFLRVALSFAKLVRIRTTPYRDRRHCAYSFLVFRTEC